MKKVRLPNGRSTTRLGFGCAGLGGAIGYTESAALLSAALDAGFRHFDVAPSYGMGVAEDFLGRFLKGTSASVTITTKAGIEPPSLKKWFPVLPAAARLSDLMPSVKKYVGNRIRQSAARERFNVAHVQRSLERSLRALRRESIDLLLLHEFTVAAYSDDLLSYLEKAKCNGLIQDFGVGSGRFSADEFALSRTPLARIIQTDWTIYDAPLVYPDTELLLTHGAFNAFHAVLDVIRKDHLSCSALSRKIGHDLSAPDGLADVLLGASLSANPKGILLVASRKPAHLRRVALATESANIEKSGVHLMGWLNTPERSAVKSL